MTEPVITVRAAGLDDAALLLAWANDPLTRAGSRRHDEIDPAENSRWLAERLATPADARMWIGELDRVPVGVVRFERREPGVVEISIAVAPDARGRGIARPLLDAGLAAARDVFGAVRFRAEVLPGNAPSVGLFVGAGFEPRPAALPETPGSEAIRRFERD